MSPDIRLRALELRRSGLGAPLIARELGISPNAYWLKKLVTDHRLPGRHEPIIEQPVSDIQPARERYSAGDEDERPGITGVTSREPADEDEVYRRAVSDFRRKSALEERKRNQRIEFPYGPVAIVLGGDEHFGDQGTDVERIFTNAELIASTPGMYKWQMGDVVNQFILGRMRSIRDGARMSIPDEWLLAKRLFRILDGKIIASVGGNHDAWSTIASGMDRLRDITADGPLYDANEIIADVIVGRSRTTIKARHKWLGSSIYNPTHPIERAAKFDEPFDVGVGAHTHIAGLCRDFIVNRRRALAILTGSPKVHDEYAKSEGFPMGDGSSEVAVIITERGERFGTTDLRLAAELLTAMRRR